MGEIRAVLSLLRRMLPFRAADKYIDVSDFFLSLKGDKFNVMMNHHAK